jgi:Uma2 family endonuclease
MSPAEQLQINEDEYLAHELASESKHEYVGGVVRAMAGASPRHNLIAANLVRALGTLVRGRPCMVFTSDQRVHVPAIRMYSYPDASVVCGRAEFHHKDPIASSIRSSSRRSCRTLPRRTIEAPSSSFIDTSARSPST